MENLFHARGIDFGAPGFYDLPAFRTVEDEDPRFLEQYARYVRSRPIPRAYAKRTRRVVRAATQFLLDRLRADRAVGRCIDGSLVLGRFLERLGVWNYVEHGGLTVTFPPGRRIPTTHFAPLMLKGNPAMTGHAWLVVPPFRVVDATVQMQPYLPGEHQFVPEIVLAESVAAAAPVADDIMEPEGVAAFLAANGREPTMADVERISPGVRDRIDRLGAKVVGHHGTSLKYVPTAVTAHDGPLETCASLELGGLRPIDLYHEFVRDLR